METRANYVAIGIFVLAVIVGGFGFIYWLAQTADTGKRANLIIEFEGTVTGLSEGGLVLFNGIKIGEVTTLALNANDPTKVQAIVKVDSTAPLKVDTKAELGFQGLTGVAHIELKGGSAEANALFDGKTVPIIKADPSAFQNLIEGAQSVLTRADRALAVVEDLVVKNRGSIDKTIANVETFSDALAKNSDGVDKFLAEVSRAADAFAGLSDNLEGLIKHADTLVAAVDPEKVAKTVDNVAKFTDALAGASGDVDSVIADFRKTAEELSTFGKNLNETLAKADKVIAGVDPKAIERVVENTDQFTAALAKRSAEIDTLLAEASGAAKNINKLTERLAARDGDIDKIITDIKVAAERFNTFSGNLNGAMDDVKELVAAVDAEKIGRVVDNVDSFTARIAKRGDDIDAIVDSAKAASKNVETFTAGIAAKQKDIDQIVIDAREFAGRLNAVSVRIDSVLGKVEGLLEGDSEGFIAEATAAAKSIRKAAESFEKRADRISAGLERFTTRGLRDFEALMAQGRQTLRTIEQTFSTLDKQPSRVIFGGSSVPKYQPQRR